MKVRFPHDTKVKGTLFDLEFIQIRHFFLLMITDLSVSKNLLNYIKIKLIY